MKYIDIETMKMIDWRQGNQRRYNQDGYYGYYCIPNSACHHNYWFAVTLGF